jgi:hypothetical protein
MMDKEEMVCVSSTKTGAKGLTLEQEYRYADTIVGRTKYCVRSVNDKFVEFEKILKNLSFKYVCAAKIGDAKYVADRLESIDIARTLVSFSPTDKTLTFSKVSSVAKTQDIVLPLTRVSGESLDLEFSSKILKKAVDQCSEDEIEIRFSGKRSLGTIRLSSLCKLFFAPFAEG